MSTPLLTTKLFAPPAQPGRLQRPRLTARLAEGLAKPLTLISAPPGFGKTCLAADWLAQQTAARSAWLSLDAGDNDPVRFWRYLTAAIQTTGLDLGQAAAGMLAAPQPPPLEAVVTSLLNDLAENAPALALVLDDYHLITNPAIHDSLSFLLDHLPPQAHLCLLTREDPPLALARRRGRGQVIEVRAADLRFSDEEVGLFLNQSMGLDLSAADAATLAARTEGWIVGLQMAAISLQGRADRHALIQSFAGDDRYIADYLIEEVLQRQPAPIQNFLLKTSVLERLCAPLCDALLDDGAAARTADGHAAADVGRSPSADVLQKLERANLFLVPLDNRREWYRYHHLFAELLHQRLLLGAGPQVVAGLHQRAGAWLAGRGWYHEAVRHYQQAGQPAEAARLAVRACGDFFARGELRELTTLVKALPLDSLAPYPELLVAYAWAALGVGDAEAAAGALEVVEGQLGVSADQLSADLPRRTWSGLVELLVIRAQLENGRGRMDRVLALLERVQPYLDRPDADLPGLHNPPANLRPVAAFNRALAHETEGRTAVAVAAYREAAGLAEQYQNPYLISFCAGRLGFNLTLQGQLRAAAQVLAHELERLEKQGNRQSPLASIALTGLGTVDYERGDQPTARRRLELGYQLAQPWRNAEGLRAGALGLAGLRLAAGDLSGSLAILEEAAELCRRHASAVSADLEAFRAVVLARAGRLAEAGHWASRRMGAPLTYATEFETLCLARVEMAQQRWAEAADHLRGIAAAAQAAGRWSRAIEAQALLAVALEAEGRRTEALEVLEQALSLAEPENFVRVFVEAGGAMRGLLSAVSGRHADHARRLSAAWGKTGAPEAPDQLLSPTERRPPLIEPLSPRELEVLVLMAQGLSNQAIADRLVISLGTVKTHTANIHGKLGVNSRGQAVNRARALGLLPAD